MTKFTEITFTLPDENGKMHDVLLIPEICEMITTHPIFLRWITLVEEMIEGEFFALPGNGFIEGVQWKSIEGLKTALVLCESKLAAGKQWHKYLPKILQEADGLAVVPDIEENEEIVY